MRAASVPQRKTVPLPSKPKGGYQLIPAVHLALAWWAYHEKLIRLVDLRVWFAAWEMRARRCRTLGPPAPTLRPRRAPGAHRAVTQAAQRITPPAQGGRAPELVGIHRGISGIARQRSSGRPRRLPAIPRPDPQSQTPGSGPPSHPQTLSRRRTARPDRHHPGPPHPLSLSQRREVP